MLKIKEFGEFLEKRFMQYKDFVDEYAIHLWHSMPYVGADVDHWQLGLGQIQKNKEPKPKRQNLNHFFGIFIDKVNFDESKKD